MKARVLFFGATADIVGTREVELSLADSVTVNDAVARMMADYPKLAGHKLKFAINQEFADNNDLLQNNDELAIFTAVSGG